MMALPSVGHDFSVTCCTYRLVVTTLSCICITHKAGGSLGYRLVPHVGIIHGFLGSRVRGLFFLVEIGTKVLRDSWLGLWLLNIYADAPQKQPP